MRNRIAIGAFVLTLVTYGGAHGGEPAYDTPPPRHFLERLHPVGGWNPYGGPLHWWNPHCFPCQAAPDDYCRKPLPKLCWPSYPRYYVWGPPEIGYPRNNGFQDSNKPH